MIDAVSNETEKGGASAPPGFREMEFRNEFNWPQRREMIEHVKANLTRNVEMLRRGPETDERMVICGGGPSIKNHIEDIKALGGRLVAMNDTAEFLHENGVTPWGNVWWEIAWNRAASINRAIPGMKYLIANHANPKTFDAVPEESVLMWHCFHDAGEREFVDAADPDGWQVAGGCSAILRTINIGIVMGYRKFDIFGIDSSSDGDSHAYYDDATDSPWIDVFCAGKTFRTRPFWARQARDFAAQIKAYDGKYDIRVWGEGLIPHMARKLGVHIENRR